MSTARRPASRRAAIVGIYLAFLAGTPVGHGLFLAIHVGTEHSGGWSTRWISVLTTVAGYGVTVANPVHGSGGSIVVHPADHHHGPPPAAPTPAVVAATTTAPATGDHPHPHRHAPDAGADHDADHHHGAPPAAPTSAVLTATTTAPTADNRLAGTPPTAGAGLHEHGGLVHSHDTDPADDLAHLTAGSSEQYLPRLADALPASVEIASRAEWRHAAMTESPACPPAPPPETLT